MAGHARARRRTLGATEAALILTATVVAVAVATTPLSTREQAVFALGTAVASLIAARVPGRGVTLSLAALSVVVTLRYLVWRIADTIPNDTWLDGLLGVGLIAAECYAAAMLALGYVQTAWPLDRRPCPLPDDPRAWPTVDVFIPTCDEPLGQVRVTVLAALAMDWPQDALTVWLLDDGVRPDFAQFAAAAGCAYIARDDRRHARAGSLNHALSQSGAAFVCVFDCDHVPTRAFLQLSMGWLVADRTLAWVQTPAHDAGSLAQQGADTWNAAIFSGVGGVLRRAALDDVGGFAVASAGEGVATSLRLHRRGWNSAYLPLTLAGGLARSRSRAGIRRRALPVGNPLIGAGLNAGQRLCYLRAAAQALVPLPRLTLMVAPLAFLLFGWQVISASPLALAAYGLLHIFHAVAARWRIADRQHEDWTPEASGRRAAMLGIGLAVLLAAGVVRGVVALAGSGHDARHPGTTLIYTIWAATAALYALLPHALAARRQARGTARVPAALPVTIDWFDGVTGGISRALSASDALIEAAGPDDIAADATLTVRVAGGDPLPARVVEWTGTSLRLRWCPTSLVEESAVIETVFGRADTWTHTAAVCPGGRLPRMLRAIGIALALIAPIGPIVGTARAQAPAERRVVYSLRQFGAAGPVALRGADARQAVAFGLRADEVVTSARLSLAGAVSPGLALDQGAVTVTVNGRYLGTILADPEHPAFSRDIDIDPVSLQDRNRLDFRLSGRPSADCDDPLSGLLWATIYDSSTLTLTVRATPPLRALARLPLPLFDAGQTGPLSLPIVLPAAPDDASLTAAAIVASWFGQLTGRGGVGFPVLTAPPATGNAVLIAPDGTGLPGAPPFDGPTLAVVANPNDALATILVVGGRNPAEAAIAATALATGETRLLGGQSARVTEPTLPERRPRDAPNWIAGNRAVRLGELVDAQALQEAGYVGLLHVPFSAAPDFDTRAGRSFPLNLVVRAPPGPVLDVATSRVDVGLNGQYLATIPLGGMDRRLVRIPAYDVHGANDLEFYFDARPLRHSACGGVPEDLRMAIDADSTIDLSDAVRVATLPNLASFVGAGFPFTRWADLSRTAIVLPETPSARESAAFLGLMGRMGASTGTAAVGVSVVRPRELPSVAERDLIVLGTSASLGDLNAILGSGPVRMDDGRVTVALPSALAPIARVFGDPFEADRARAAAVLSTGLGPDTALLVGAENPLAAGRSVVALLAASPDALDAAVTSFADDRIASLIRGDLSILSDGSVTSYRTQPPYTIGTPPWWLYPAYLLGDRPLLLLLVALIVAAVVGVVAALGLRARAGRRLAPNRGGTV